MEMYLPLMGLYNYDSTILDNLTFPDGIDVQLAKNSILKNCAEYPLLYPDPDYIRDTVPIWCAENAYKWKTLYNTTVLDYDPIENYNRYEDWTEQSNTNGKVTGSTNSDGSSTHGVYGFDGGAVVNSTTDAAQDSSNTTTDSTGTENNTRTGHAHGNIGVTTSQQMLQSERDVAAFSIYKTIADDFALEFCVLIL